MKTILITGGASGFGRGVAMHYLKRGDRVIAVGLFEQVHFKLWFER